MISAVIPAISAALASVQVKRRPGITGAAPCPTWHRICGIGSNSPRFIHVGSASSPENPAPCRACGAWAVFGVRELLGWVPTRTEGEFRPSLPQLLAK